MAMVTITGDIDKKFKEWLEFSFGFYSDSALISNDYDSNVLYQYDPELDALVSSYSTLTINNVDNYELIIEKDMATLNLKQNDTVWYALTCMWFNINPTKNLNTKHLIND